MRIEIVVPIEPKAQKRARHGVVNGRAIAYTDSKQRTEASKLHALLYEHRPSTPWDGPVILGVKAYLPIPASKAGKWKVAAESGAIRPTTRPDLDNLLKMLKDVMSGIFWKDDRQVVEYLPGTGKYYGRIPRWEIVVESLSCID